MVKPELDYMTVVKHEPKSTLILSEDTNAKNTMFAFEITAIGDGRWEHGIFIPTKHKIGDWVFINGPVIEVKYKGNKVLLAREKDVVASDPEKGE